MTMTDELTSERLDALEMTLIEWQEWRHDPAPIPHSDVFALIAMAKRTHQAESERDDLRSELARSREGVLILGKELAGIIRTEVEDAMTQVEQEFDVMRAQWETENAVLAEPTGAGGDA